MMLTKKEYISKVRELAKNARDSVKARILSETTRQELLNIVVDFKLNFVQENIFELAPESKTFKNKILKFEVLFNVPSFENLSGQALSNVQTLFEQQLYNLVKDNAPESIEFNSSQLEEPTEREAPKEFNHKPILIGLSVIATVLIGTAIYIERKK